MTSRSSKRRLNAASSAFGTAVADALAERQMSQLDLASSLGKSLAYTNQTLTGRKSASPQWVNLVAEALRLSSTQRAELHRAAARDQGYEIDLGEYRPAKTKRKRD
jgi:cyanate lyase